MNAKKIVIFCLLFFICITMCKSVISQTDAVGDYISMPYFGENKIRFYRASTAVLYHTFDLAPEFVNFPIPFGGPNVGPNATAIYNGKIFISFDNDPVGGVLIYNYSDIYPVRNANPPIIISTTPVAGIVIHPLTEDLYVAKFNDGTNSGKITRYSKSTGYFVGSAFDLPIPNTWVNYFTGIAFDANHNLWTGDLWDHRIICFKASSNYDNFYVVGNGMTNMYPALTLTGGSVNVRLLSAPEGFAFDNFGNLWVSNNNDWHLTNNPGEGTFVKFSPGFQVNLLTMPPSGTRADPNVATVYTVSSAFVVDYYLQDAKFGGMTFKDNTLYLNDQGTGLRVWKWDISTSYNNTNFFTSGINTTYPGFGGLSFNDNTFPFGIKTISENIPESFSLGQNYPNPFNPSTKFKFDIAKLGNANLVVFDVLGKEIETLVNGHLKPGTYEVEFDASHLTSGVYFYKLETGDFVDTKKMILIK